MWDVKSEWAKIIRMNRGWNFQATCKYDMKIWKVADHHSKCIFFWNHPNEAEVVYTLRPTPVCGIYHNSYNPHLFYPSRKFESPFEINKLGKYQKIK